MKHKIYVLAFLVLASFTVSAETVQLPVVEVTTSPPTKVVSRLEQGKVELPNNTSFNRSLADSISADVEVSGQATGVQQQSPIIHGFTAYRNVMTIDGIRLNNGTFRDGPNQYWSTIDPYTVDYSSMAFGQAAMQSGSDVFGAAVDVHTRKRTDYSKEGFNWNGRTAYRFGSAEASNIGRLEFEGNYGKKLGFLIGTSIKGYGDITGGEKTGVQPHTGYDEQDADVRLDYNVSDRTRVTFANQHYRSNDAWRTHSTIYGNTLFGNDPGSYEYRYYNQNRDLSYLKLDTVEVPFFSSFTATASFQHVTEDQFRKKPNKGKFDQGFEDNVAGLNLKATNDNTRIGNLTYGLDYYHDFINSYGKQYNRDGSFNSLAVQGPVADNSGYDNLGLYITDDYHIVPDRVILSLTSRYNYVAAKSGNIEDANSPTGASAGLNKSWDSVTNGGRLSVGLDEHNHYKAFVGANQGWRAPTIFDLTGDELARSTDVQVPTPDVGPEKFVTYETGIGYSDKRVQATATYFNTQLKDVIVRYPTGAVIDGDIVVKGKNDGVGFVHGIAVKADYLILPTLKATSGIAWTEGHLSEYSSAQHSWVDGSSSRVNPLNGNLGLHWDVLNNVFAETSARLVASQNRLSGRDLSDTQRIPPGGSKGYALLGVRAGWQPIKNLALTGAVDNLLNEDYRPLGSGVNGLGRNFIMAVDYKF